MIRSCLFLSLRFYGLLNTLLPSQSVFKVKLFEIKSLYNTKLLFLLQLILITG